MILKRIRSGGQNGVDIASVRAAKISGVVEYGGIMPLGFKTLDGPKPEYAVLYNMKEHSSATYPPRTFENVRDSDATLRIAGNFDSAGEKCTLKAIQQYKKPYFDVLVTDVKKFQLAPETHPEAVAKWIMENNIKDLNCAGNSERTYPGIEAYAERFVIALLKILQRG